MHSYLTGCPECDSVNEGILKGALREIILVRAVHNRVSAIPTGFLVCLLKEAQMFGPKTTSVRHL